MPAVAAQEPESDGESIFPQMRCCHLLIGRAHASNLSANGFRDQSTANVIMNVLILGSGAREHALARACRRSPMLGKLLVAPGNPGCATLAETRPIDLADHRQIVELCKHERIELVVVGPEAPLVAGIADDLEKEGIACFGPSRLAARLEGSKGFAKEFCREFGIPTPDYSRFRSHDDAKAYIRSRGAPIVVKADGLAAGKGVIVASTIEEAEAAVDTLLRRSDSAPSMNASTFLATTCGFSPNDRMLMIGLSGLLFTSASG